MSGSILHVIINAIPIRPGGGLTVLLGLLAGWRATRAPAQVTVLVGDSRAFEAVAASGNADDVRTVLLDAGTARQFLWQNTSLQRLLRQLAPDVLLTTNHDLPGISCPVVIHHQNLKRFVPAEPGRARSLDLREGIRNRLARRGLRKAAANVFISNFMRQMAEYCVPESAPRNHVVLNGVSDELIEAARSVPDRYDGRAHLAAIQSPSRYKDTPTLLRAAAVLRRREPGVDWRLSIAGGCGRGSWHSQRRLAVSLGLERSVSWLGYCDQGTLDQILRESLCLVFPSTLEGFGLPLIEAMARRCPVVAARAAAVPEVIADAGMLVEPQQAEAFAEAILRLYRESDLRRALVLKGVERVQGFSWSTSSARLFEILASCVHASRGASVMRAESLGTGSCHVDACQRH